MTTRFDELSRRRMLQVMAATSAAAGASLLAACGSSGVAANSVATSTRAPATTATIAASTSARPTAITSAASTTTAVSSTAAATTATHSVTAANSGSAKGQQGVLWGISYPPHVERYHMLADAFNKKTGANLIVQPQAGDIRQKVITVIAAGTPPDVICLMGKLLLPLVSGQALINVSDLFKVWKINPEQDFAGDSIGAYTYDHTVWGVPVEVNMVGSSVAVPLDEVQKASLNSSTPPTNGKDFFDSYDQLWNVARRTQLVQNGQVTRWGLTSEGWELHSLCGIIRSQGVNWWDEAARKFNVYSDAGITAFKLLVETPVRMKIETELKMLSVDAVVKGKVALARGNASIPYAALTATGLGGKGSKRGPYELAMVPPVKGPLSGTNPLFVGEGGWGFIAAKSTPHRDLSVEFLHFIASPDGEGIWAGIYGGSPSAWRALNTPDNPRWGNTSDPVIRGLIRYSKYLDRTIYFGEGFGDETPIEGKAQALAVDIRQGKLTAELAAQQLQQFCETQYQKYLASLKK